LGNDFAGNPFVAEPEVALRFCKRRIDDRILDDDLIVSHSHAWRECAPERWRRQLFEMLKTEFENASLGFVVQLIGKRRAKTS
jgi:hypothetical protein